MTLWDFAAEHAALAVFFAVLAFALPVTLAGLFVSWRLNRLVKYSAEDRRALNAAAARIRHTALVAGADGHWASRDAQRAEAEALERMAGR